MCGGAWACAQVYWAVYSEEGGGGGGNDGGTTAETTPTPTGTFTLRTDSGYAAGAVAFNNYSSSLDNNRLLMGYGFALHPNPASSHTVKLRQDSTAATTKEGGGGTASNDNVNVARRQLRSAAVAASSMHRCTVETPLPPPMMAALAAAAADERQLHMIHGRLSGSAEASQGEEVSGSRGAWLQPHMRIRPLGGELWQIAAEARLQVQ